MSTRDELRLTTQTRPLIIAMVVLLVLAAAVAVAFWLGARTPGQSRVAQRNDPARLFAPLPAPSVAPTQPDASFGTIDIGPVQIFAWWLQPQAFTYWAVKPTLAEADRRIARALAEMARHRAVRLLSSSVDSVPSLSRHRHAVSSPRSGGRLLRPAELRRAQRQHGPAVGRCYARAELTNLDVPTKVSAQLSIAQGGRIVGIDIDARRARPVDSELEQCLARTIRMWRLSSALRAQQVHFSVLYLANE